MGIYITGCKMTRFGRSTAGLITLMEEAATKTLSSVSGKGKTPSALIVSSMNPQEFTGDDNITTMLADRLGLTPIPAFRIENAPASGSCALHQAVHAVQSRVYDPVRVVGGEKMTEMSTQVISKLIAKLTPFEERSLGITMPALVAMMTRRYMHEYGLSREDLALIPVKSHDIGAMNPLAHFQKRVTVEDVLTSPVISEPLRLYDCAPISDGASALIVTSKTTGVEVSGLGHGADTLYYQHRNSLSSFPSSAMAAQAAYSTARIGPKDVDVVETHDAFSILELVNCEDLGLFDGGKSIDAVKEGVTGLNGSLPVNPSGGLKAKGHPVGATGIAQVCELFWQLTGQAGQRQIGDVTIGLAHNIGGFGNNAAVTILRKVQ
jgi:acetyl-CoA C-acetyltransferase